MRDLNLSERARLVLKLVIEEYIATAKPVASATLRDKYGLGVSSATLRNEMAELEKMGYLTHLHTSGGRVPSEAGYRLYVENLMDNLGLSPADLRRVEHQFHQIERVRDIERWAELAASVLAQLANNAALVTTPQSENLRLKRIHLIQLHDRSALVIAVMDDGTVRQSVYEMPYEASQEELDSIAAALNAEFAGEVTSRLVRRARDLPAPVSDIVRAVIDVVSQASGIGEVHQVGLTQMLAQPEFQSSERARPVIEMIEGGSLLRILSERVARWPGVHVIIGSEIPIPEMQNCAIVTATYRAAGGSQGLLTVVGPMRMRYKRTISSVYYLSNLLSELLSDKYLES
ncbi:heat-inducible transcription repressor HrcA [Thermobaculum terrenum ATCC BAA-798]|uniref:Heat-inducible transcription repressor HrcA n=1 Tax=Thermobaculum terrenum (strain ATCC BAA-798 / CCMEE 7001 / YNP1) TaxID=525904 RepID=D1CCY9_THET1|nr:heat-inducible transcriptional repressor HrcA [Thermobaculum terrenum]ACZ42654.1 heat-inducible transcription repressor HrcA [Thermobaculum terrenum ATCC BAA-798]